MNDTLWQTKLAARIHDPAEKALVLLRDPAGHENGTSKALKRLLGLDALRAETLDPDNEVLSKVVFKKGLPVKIYRHVQRADWWAAAADRPQWPMEEITVTTKKGEEKTLKVADWAQVRWSKRYARRRRKERSTCGDWRCSSRSRATNSATNSALP